MIEEKTDKEKLVLIAETFGDHYVDRPKSLTVSSWGRRFSFTIHGEVCKVQDIIGADRGGRLQYKTISEE